MCTGVDIYTAKENLTIALIIIAHYKVLMTKELHRVIWCYAS